MKENQNQTYLILDREYIIETFEALCSLPFTRSTISECEPATKREPGIEQLIEQLEPLYKKYTEYDGE